jgi:hypothetical protein
MPRKKKECMHCAGRWSRAVFGCERQDTCDGSVGVLWPAKEWTLSGARPAIGPFLKIKYYKHRCVWSYREGLSSFRFQNMWRGRSGKVVAANPNDYSRPIWRNTASCRVDSNTCIEINGQNWFVVGPRLHSNSNSKLVHYSSRDTSK